MVRIDVDARADSSLGAARYWIDGLDSRKDGEVKMRWTPEQIKQLTNACMIGTSNGDMAKFFGVSVQQIQDKRSELEITIPQVKELRKARKQIVKKELETSVKPLMIEHKKSAPSPLERKHRRRVFTRKQLTTLERILQAWGYDKYDVENVALALAVATGKEAT